MTKFLFKANNDVLSFCTCTDEPAMSEGQLDCPWCGCGWLICCSKCGKAFTYGEIREIDTPLDVLAGQEFEKRGYSDTGTADDIARWADFMTKALAPFNVGQTVVYLDGEYFALDARNVKFKGIFANHDLSVLPHYEALTDAAKLVEALSDTDYWLKREHEDSQVD